MDLKLSVAALSLAAVFTLSAAPQASAQILGPESPISPSNSFNPLYDGMRDGGENESESAEDAKNQEARVQLAMCMVGALTAVTAVAYGAVYYMLPEEKNFRPY